MLPLVEHPARLRCSNEIALAQWRPSYQRATVMQASLATASSLLGISAWLNQAGRLWLVAGLPLGSVRAVSGPSGHLPQSIAGELLG